MSLVISEEKCPVCPNPPYEIYTNCKECLGTGRKLVTLEQALKSLGFHMPGDVILLANCTTSPETRVPGEIK